MEWKLQHFKQKQMFWQKVIFFQVDKKSQIFENAALCQKPTAFQIRGRTNAKSKAGTLPTAGVNVFEPSHDKTNKMIRLGIRPAWSESSLRAQCPAESSHEMSAKWRLWSDWVDAQADLSLRWAISHFVGFVMRLLKFWILDYYGTIYTILQFWC